MTSSIPSAVNRLAPTIWLSLIADLALIPDIEAFEERVAIDIHEGGFPTDQVKDLEAQAQGFRNQAHYWAWLRVYISRKSLG